MPWKEEFKNALNCGKYSQKQDALEAIEVAKLMGWFDDETEYQETVQLVNDFFEV